MRMMRASASRKPRGTLTPESIECARKAFESGIAVSEVAELFGVSTVCIQKRATSGGWDRKGALGLRHLRIPRKPRTARLIAADARALFERGGTMVAVLRVAHMSESGLRARAIVEGWDTVARANAIRALAVERRGRCRVCAEQKPPSEFYMRVDRPGRAPRRDTRCRDCCCAHVRLRDERLSGGPLTREELAGVFAKGKRCVYCERPLASREKTLDHLLPVSRGGEHSRENVAIACRRCNASKGARTPMEWILGIRPVRVAIAG
jgi:5-methylcytosine-specific restriction endonuclease McrA